MEEQERQFGAVMCMALARCTPLAWKLLQRSVGAGWKSLLKPGSSGQQNTAHTQLIQSRTFHKQEGRRPWAQTLAAPYALLEELVPDQPHFRSTGMEKLAQYCAPSLLVTTTPVDIKGQEGGVVCKCGTLVKGADWPVLPRYADSLVVTWHTQDHLIVERGGGREEDQPRAPPLVEVGRFLSEQQDGGGSGSVPQHLGIQCFCHLHRYRPANTHHAWPREDGCDLSRPSGRWTCGDVLPTAPAWTPRPDELAKRPQDSEEPGLLACRAEVSARWVPIWPPHPQTPRGCSWGTLTFAGPAGEEEAPPTGG